MADGAHIIDPYTTDISRKLLFFNYNQDRQRQS